MLQAALVVRADGRWSTPQVALSAPRQNGKSQLIVARAEDMEIAAVVLQVGAYLLVKHFVDRIKALLVLGT